MKKTQLAGFDGIQSENMYLLFDKVKAPPATTPDSAIWHFGWGSAAMEADYQISSSGSGPAPRPSGQSARARC